MSSAVPIASHVAYCREARRLRSRCADRPASLYQSLRRLSDKVDREPRSAPALLQSPEDRAAIEFNDSVARASGAMTLTPAAMAFIPTIRESLDGPILRYTARQRLLRAADRLGIGRFHANLLIALVQHELQKREPAHAPPVPSAGGPQRWMTRLAPIAVLLVLECIAALAVWHALHG